MKTLNDMMASLPEDRQARIKGTGRTGMVVDAGLAPHPQADLQS